MDYLYRLIELINSYDGSPEIEHEMRDLICFLSEHKEYRANDLYRTVIFEASEKLRVFGYIKGKDPISVDDFAADDFYSVKQQAIQSYYASKVFPNNILDRKQKEIVDNFMRSDKKRLLVSAPTSFGKTYILREILFLNQDRYKNILLVFPTIALLNENTDSIKDLIRVLGSDYKIVNNVYSSIDETDRHIFILTPERVLKLLSDQEDLNIDFFFFDEVYKIDEDFSSDEDSSAEVKEYEAGTKKRIDNGNRAKAFRITLYLLTKRVKEFYLAGPYLNLDNAKHGFVRFIQENDITVAQVDFEPTMRIEIDAWKKSAMVKHPVLGESEVALFSHGSPSTTEKIAGIIGYLQANQFGQAIFYCSTPANSMNYVRSVIAATPSQNKKINEKFIAHLKQKYGISIKGVTRNSAEHWSLVRALENGFGIHHGKFPKYIQNEILRMFNQNEFPYLFCTSTIIEGVNTNAKNVVVINNSVGNHTMSAFALKNIRGRAGRYYHHYIGRVFYTDPKQRKIEATHELQLDFPTYGNSELLDVDLDNVMLDDLSEVNQARKTSRDETLHFNFLPDSVFTKNRLYARDIQEQYLSHILDPKVFSQFQTLINNSANIHLFLEEKMMNRVLESLENCGILDKNKANVYHSVVSKYSIEGTRGVITYHVETQIKAEKAKAKKEQRNGIDDPSNCVDRAYIKSFDQIRNIVEYEVPKLLCLFESIFSYAATIKGYDMTDFNLSPVIRFFELGITTEFGLSLVEYGFPVDTIRDLEKKFSQLASLSTLEAIQYLRKKENHPKVVALLDEYELILFRNAIKSFEK